MAMPSPTPDDTTPPEAVATREATREATGVTVLQFAPRPTPQARFTQVPNEYLEAMADLGGGAFKCLMYLMRHTRGFHRDEVKLSLDDFCNGRKRADGSRMDRGTGLSKPSVIAGLAELEVAGLVETDDANVGRTTVRTYTLKPAPPTPAEVPACQVSLQAPTSQETLQVAVPACKETSQVAAPACKVSLPPRNIGREKQTSTSGQHGRVHARAVEEPQAPTPQEPEATPPTPAPTPTPRPPSRFDSLHPKDRATCWAIVETLREGAGWRANEARDPALVWELAHDYDLPLNWLRLQATKYANWEGDDPERPVKHTRTGFVNWVTTPHAAEALATWRSSAVSTTGAAVSGHRPPSATTPERRGASPHANGRPTDRPATTRPGAPYRARTSAPAPSPYTWMDERPRYRGQYQRRTPAPGAS